MGLILLLLILALLYAVFRPKKDAPESILKNSTLVDANEHNRQWTTFVMSYRQASKSKSQLSLINAMLADLQSQGMTGGVDVSESVDSSNAAAVMAQTAHTTQATQPYTGAIPNTPDDISTAALTDYSKDSAAVGAMQKSKAQLQLDNASLLLYLGAFLFVSAVGLFVAVGSMPGEMRTVMVALVSVILYAGGVWLHGTQPKFKQAALAFVGIGMAIMPLVGLAAYGYVFDRTNAPIAWLLTSVLCTAMYAHAMIRLRATLLDYLFIFTIVSLFESTVSVIDLPVYYFGWCLAVIGIVSLVLSHVRAIGHLDMPTKTLSQLFVPLSVLVAAVLASDPSGGVVQLSISLLIAAAYYTLQAWFEQFVSLDVNSVAQVSAVAGCALLAQGIWSDTQTTAVVLLAASVLQTLVLYVLPRQAAPTGKNAGLQTALKRFGSLALLSYGAGLLVAVNYPVLCLGALLVCTLGSSAIWLRQRRGDAYAVAVTAWMTLPAVYELYVASQQSSSKMLAALLTMAALLVQCGVVVLAQSRFAADDERYDEVMYILSATFLLLLSFFVGPWLTFGLAVATAATLVLLSVLQPNRGWDVYIAAVCLVPLAWFGQSPGVLLAATTSALVTAIALALVYRSDVYRWMSAVLWLLLPVAFGSGGLLWGKWSLIVYAWSYGVVMAGMLLSRSIARGVVLVSGKVPLMRYTSTASRSYQLGYWFAGVTSVLLAFAAPNSQLHGSLLLGLFIAAIVFASLKIEKDDSYLSAVPVLTQLLLFSAMRPSSEATTSAYLAMASGLAVSSYFLVTNEQVGRTIKRSLQFGGLLAVWLVPMAVLFTEHAHAVMALGLMAAGGLYVHDAVAYKKSQSTKEAYTVVIVAGLLWLLNVSGVQNVQVYTHIVAAMLAGFAYWRHVVGDESSSASYMYAALSAVTVPLALQALQSTTYAWWLLLEQIGIMLYGMSIGKRPLVTWGLYVTVGAVLWQLRGFGWAALGFLALFLIVVAVRKIQKNA